MGLTEIILDKMNTTGYEELLVVLNGRYVYRSGKLVYAKSLVSRQETNELVFFTKSSGQPGVDNTPLPDFCRALRQELLCTTLYGIEMDGLPCLEMCFVDVCASLNLLILESCLYQSAKMIVAAGNTGSRLRIGDVTNSSEDTQRLADAFRRESYADYGNLVYANGSNRFLNKLLKINKFYSIQKAFVPVFIDFKAVYNPLKDKMLGVTATKLYQLAVEKNRYVVFDDKLSCYFLTHKEICVALGMRHFVRFTSNFWYKMFVGLLHPTLLGFPGTMNKVYAATNNLNKEFNLLHAYETFSYLEKVRQLEEEVENVLMSEKSALLKKLDFLHSYTEMDTLYFACIEAYGRLTSFGPTSIDNKEDTTLMKIYQYMAEAKLQY